jgi:hypothetical protein
MMIGGAKRATRSACRTFVILCSDSRLGPAAGPENDPSWCARTHRRSLPISVRA